MRVAVIGAGIGGLCAAIGLQRAGASVVVFEKERAVRAGGSALSVFGNGLRALDSIGVGDAFRGITSAEAARYRGGQRRPDGSWLSTYPSDAISELRIVDRAQLHGILTAALAPGTLRNDHRAVAVSPSGEVHLQGGSEPERFDLVVAADGIRSATRQAWKGDPGIAYSGYSTWRGITSGPFNLRGEAGETWGIRQRFGLAPLADGRAYWFAVVSVREGAEIDTAKSRVEELFEGWHAPIGDVIRATEADRILFHPIDRLAGPLATFVSGNVVLLGDAAHAMTPDLGQGGGQAMEDAATLTALLSSLAPMAAPRQEKIREALARYDALRRPRTQKISQRARLVGQLAHGPGRPFIAARDLLLRLTPESALRRQLIEVQDWSSPAPVE